MLTTSGAVHVRRVRMEQESGVRGREEDDHQRGIRRGLVDGIRGIGVRDPVRDGQGANANERKHVEVCVVFGVRARDRANGGNERIVRGILADVFTKQRVQFILFRDDSLL